MQELERQWHNGSIDLYYGDESNICEQAYVPYGWRFSKEGVCIPSKCGAGLNCFAMIDRHCHTLWFTTEKALMPTTMVSFLDDFSLNIKRKTVRVLDNAPIHRAKQTARTSWIVGEMGAASLLPASIFSVSRHS